MAESTIRVELELVDGAFITSIQRTKQSIQDLVRTVDQSSSVITRVEQRTTLLGRSANELNKALTLTRQTVANLGETFKNAADKDRMALPALMGTLKGANEALERFKKAKQAIGNATGAVSGAGGASAGQKPAAQAKVAAEAQSGAAQGGKAQRSEPLSSEAANEAFQKLGRDWTDVTARMKEASVQWMTVFSDRLHALVKTGNVKFGDLARSVAADLIRIPVQMMIVKAVTWMGDALGVKTFEAAPVGQKQAVQATAGSGEAKGGAAKDSAVTGGEAKSGDGTGGKAAEDPFDKFAREWGDSTARMKEASVGWMTDFSDRLSTFVMTGKIKFGEFARSVIADLVKIQVRELMVKSLSALFGWGTATASAPAATVGVGEGIFRTAGAGMATTPGWEGFSGAYHTGGIVGLEPTFSRFVPTSLFANAKRFHGGGFPGLSAGEVPAILKKGEGVFTPEQMAALGGLGGAGGGQQINNTVNVTVNGNGGNHEQNADLANQIGRQVQDQMKVMVLNTMRDQMRPGGLLRGGM
ncbi:MAG TPA: phage tail tape measure C-terminal domain-containing protein [Azospirillum sp.]|nr:phage tail tape measure C-terminal domain-containing protein [Azospirillum sp.]